MSVRLKGNRWEVRIRAGAGQRIERRLPPGATRNDAYALEAALRKRIIQSAAGRVDYTLIEALDRWQIDAEHLKSWERDLRYRADVLRDIVGTRTISQITDVVDILKKRGKKEGLKPASVNRYLAILKRLASLAWKWGWTDQPLTARIELLAGEVRRTTYATPADLRKLMAASDYRLRDMLQFAALTGLRRGEMLQITPAMIDNDTLIVPPEITKTGRARVIPLPREAEEIAKRSLPWPLSAANLRKLFDQARAAAGLPNLHWHDLRRSYGTWLLQSGSASLADVRDLLGHGDIKTTSIYLATARKDLTKAVSGLPELGEARGKKKRSNNTRKTA